MLFLGIIVDSIKMTLELDKTRLKELKDLLQAWGNKSHASLQEIQSLVGVLSFASTCICQGRSFFSGILNFLREIPETGKHKIQSDVQKHINWWRLVAPKFSGGGYFNGKYFHFSFSANLIAAGKFINQFELFVLWKVVELWADRIRQKNIFSYTVITNHCGLFKVFQVYK